MCGDEAALLRAVAEAPADDVPRLVYADWLDEHGRPRRAEFIRAQCGRARPGDPPAHRTALLRRSLALFRRHGRKWLARDWPEADGAYLNGYTFDRGFVAELTLAPGLDAGRFQELCEARPLLALVRRLDLGHNPVGDDGLRALAASRWAAGVTRLSVVGAGATDAGLEVLAASPHLGSLAEVSVSFGLAYAVRPLSEAGEMLDEWLAALPARQAEARERRTRVEDLFRRHGKAVRIDPHLPDE